MRRGVWLLATASCGRFGFGAVPAGPTDGAAADARPISGLVVRYPMDDDPQTGAIAADLPAYSTTCTACPTATAGHLGGGYAFDGTQTFELPSGTLISLAPLTIAVWVAASSAATKDMSVVGKPESPTTDFDVMNVVVFRPGVIYFETWDGSGNFQYVTTTQSVNDTWHHVAVTWDGASKSVYIDGAMAGTKPATLVDSSAFPVRVGSDLDSNVEAFFYIGALDELEFYDRALTASEIATLAAR